MANDFFYKKVEAYKKAKALTKQVYALVLLFPSYEQYAMSDQLRRAAVSIPSNIAEGLGRISIKERIHFLEIAYGSLTEVTCQMDIAESLGYITQEELTNFESAAAEVGRLLSGLRKALIEKMNLINKREDDEG
jgi:four helix bundle protein